MARPQHGFTVLELMIVVTAIGVILAVAMPTYSDMVREVRATQAVADMQTLRAAAYLYFGDHAEWPDEVQAGAIPIGLRPYLPEAIELMNEYYKIDWDNWMVWDNPVGGPGNGKGKGKGLGKAKSKFPQTGVLVGVSLVTDYPELMDTARGMLANTDFIKVSAVKSTLKLADADGF